MGTLGRRSFLGGAMAVAAGVATAGAAQAWPAPTREERRRAVVIGTGFGGGVAALRLGEAGVDTLVLERGQWWPTGPDKDTFTKLLLPDKRCGWFRPTPPITASPPTSLIPYAGVMEKATFDTIDLICGAGVGGGSLVYHGATWQPSAENFARVMPAGMDYDEMARVYYPRAAAMLGATPVPDDVLGHERYHMSKRFFELGAEAGFEQRRFPVTLDWDVVRRELRGELQPWVTVGEFTYGVNNGAKRSLDTTYLPKAIATGRVEVAALHEVTSIGRDAQGRWVTEANHISPYGAVLERVRITSDALVVAAGSLNTNRLLVTAKGRGDLPGLPDEIGQGWGNNGDRLFGLVGVNENLGTLQGGTICGGVVAWDSDDPVTLEPEPLPTPVEARLLPVFGMGIPEGRGQFVYNSLTGQARLNWPSDADARSREAIRAQVVRLQEKVGGVVVDLNAVDKVCAHLLGGAVLGKATDLFGRVHDHPGLYVTDSALMPGSTGAVNPSLTITAVAERCLDTIVRDDVGSVF